MARRWWLPVAAVVVGLAVVLPVTGRATQRLGERPHARADRCQACHAQTASGELGAPLPVLPTCLGCHPDADMHPVGMRPEHVAVAAGWPLEEGTVSCATCHAEPGCDATREQTAPWLRGGTPARKADFCYRCHASQELHRQSPHLAVGETDAGKAGCPACHGVRPEPGALVAAAGLLLPPAETCSTCHPGPAHTGAAEHVGKVQPPGTLSAEAAHALPLGEGGTIGCWTCHEVHAAPRPAAKASPLASALSGAPPPDGPEALLALPAADGALCGACHGTGP